MERGSKSPTVTRLFKVCKAMKVRPSGSPPWCRRVHPSDRGLRFCAYRKVHDKDVWDANELSKSGRRTCDKEVCILLAGVAAEVEFFGHYVPEAAADDLELAARHAMDIRFWQRWKSPSGTRASCRPWIAVGPSGQCSFPA